jgi:hypothetical protein
MIKTVVNGTARRVMVPLCSIKRTLLFVMILAILEQKKNYTQKPILKELIGRTNDVDFTTEKKETAGLTFFITFAETCGR